jgi:hypothetical protein
MKSTILFTAIIASLSLTTTLAQADDNDDLLQQVVALVTKNADANTGEQAKQYVQDNQGLINAIFKSYRSYLDQTQAITSDDEPIVDSAHATAGNAAQNTQNSRTAATKTMLQTGSLQASGKVEASGKLEGAHLAGYPALPDALPVSSITNPTAAQLEQGRKVDELLRQQKLFYMRNPAPYHAW